MELTGMAGTASNDVWAVGVDLGAEQTPTALHWDGTTWDATAVAPGATSELLSQVWAGGTSDVWAVGGGLLSIIVHWDGNSWSVVPSGNVNLQSLFGIWGSGPADVWAVGAGGGIVHYDGSTWCPVTSPTTKYLSAVWGDAPNDVWAVGIDGTILHFQ